LHLSSRSKSRYRRQLPALEFLSKLPGIDRNRPLPHGLHAFPDIFSRSRVKRLALEAGLGHSGLLEEGGVALYAARSDVNQLLFKWPGIDPNQKGKFNETVFFRFGGLTHVDFPGAAVNTTERHGNHALVCAIRSGFDARLPTPCAKCDFTSSNENGDIVGKIIQDRAKRGATTESPNSH
jgi:hypothetical protein